METKYKKILFVDSNAHLIDSYKKTLEDLGYTVIEVNADPHAAIRLETVIVEEN